MSCASKFCLHLPHVPVVDLVLGQSYDPTTVTDVIVLGIPKPFFPGACLHALLALTICALFRIRHDGFDQRA